MLSLASETPLTPGGLTALFNTTASSSILSASWLPCNGSLVLGYNCLKQDHALPDCNSQDEPSGPEIFVTGMPDKVQRKRKPHNDPGRLLPFDHFCNRKHLLLVACHLQIESALCCPRAFWLRSSWWQESCWHMCGFATVPSTCTSNKQDEGPKLHRQPSWCTTVQNCKQEHPRSAAWLP